MFDAEMVAVTTLDPGFHRLAEQITGINPAQVAQAGQLPRSKHAYTLAYYKAFGGGDVSEIKSILGMLHFTVLCAASDLDMSEAMGNPHGLRCFSCPISRRGIVGVIFAGDGQQWASAIQNAGIALNEPTQEWGRACYNQFAKHQLDELIGTIRATGNGYLLEN